MSVELTAAAQGRRNDELVGRSRRRLIRDALAIASYALAPSVSSTGLPVLLVAVARGFGAV